MNLCFRRAGIGNFCALARLSGTLTPEQQTFIAHNACSMLEASDEPAGGTP